LGRLSVALAGRERPTGLDRLGIVTLISFSLSSRSAQRLVE